MNPSSPATAFSLISDLFWGLVIVWHCWPWAFVQPWSSMFTLALFAPVHSPLILAARHLIVEWPAVIRVVSRPEPENACFSVTVTGIHSYLLVFCVVASVSQVPPLYFPVPNVTFTHRPTSGRLEGAAGDPNTSVCSSPAAMPTATPPCVLAGTGLALQAVGSMPPHGS